MKRIAAAAALILAFAACSAGGGGGAPPSDFAPAQTEYLPPAGKGRVVVVLSGHSGPSQYKPIAAEVATLGYYTVLLDGKDILAEDQHGGERLQAAILRAQKSPSALPGKVAVIGFSQGGGGALTYATRLPDLVAIVVAWYPQTDFITRHTDYKTYVGRMKVPALILAGEKDNYYDCCVIESMRALEASARELGTPLDLVVYPEANHGFNLPAGLGYRAADTADAWGRSTALLRQYLGG
jgi:pimeloyl-ACP methyl ester carboxylesterase